MPRDIMGDGTCAERKRCVSLPSTVNQHIVGAYSFPSSVNPENVGSYSLPTTEDIFLFTLQRKSSNSNQQVREMIGERLKSKSCTTIENSNAKMNVKIGVKTANVTTGTMNDAKTDANDSKNEDKNVVKTDLKAATIQEEKREKKNFIKQLFGYKKHKERHSSESENESTDMNDSTNNNNSNNNNNDNNSNNNKSKNHNKINSNNNDNIGSPSKRKISSSTSTIPEIYINGIQMSEDRIDEEIRKHLKIEDLFANLDDKCSVSGEGLVSGMQNEANVFYAETESDFDKSKLDVIIKGPKQKPIRTESVLLTSTTCRYTYWPRKNGVYTIYIAWENKAVVGSPFSIPIY